MAEWLWLLIVVAAIVVVSLIVVGAMRSRRSAALRDRFGPEYERRVSERGDRKATEAELRQVAKRRESLEIRQLSDASRARFSERWQMVQSDFVDQPDRAVAEADALVAEVMRQRGYPVDDFEDRYDMVAVDHPAVAEHYRAAHATFLRNDERMASTDDLRQALLHYRRLFDELLEPSPATR
jgi:FtsZ-interacting cell division protein ZipA